MRNMLLILCIAVITIPFSGCKQKSKTITKSEESAKTIIDHNGNTVELPAEINRIVVTDIYPLASVISVFLGSAEKLTGIHPVCMSAAESGLLGELFPGILNAETGFMTGSDLNIEELFKLEPDVVFYNASSTALGETLMRSGITAVAVSPSKWDYDILRTYDEWISLLSGIFPERSGVFEKVSSYSKDSYNKIQASTASLRDNEKKRILFLFKYDETSMITSGKKFFGQFWCDAVGGINVAENMAAENSNALINMEQVYEWDPEVIFITNFTTTQPEDLYKNTIGGDDWSTVNAVRNKNVFKIPLGTYRGYTPGADTPVILSWMAKRVYPDLFAHIDVRQEVRDYYKNLYNVELSDEQINTMYNPSRSGAAGYQN